LRSKKKRKKKEKILQNNNRSRPREGLAVGIRAYLSRAVYRHDSAIVLVLLRRLQQRLGLGASGRWVKGCATILVLLKAELESVAKLDGVRFLEP